MEILNKAEYERKKKQVIENIKKGAVFIYPSDTIYGIGCDATNAQAVTRVRKIKGNLHRPLSVMVPGMEWIYSNLEITAREEEWLSRLPGPYTLILFLKNPSCVANNVGAEDSLGIRVPNHWARELSSIIGRPIISTSANLSGGMFMTSIEDLHEDVKKAVDFIIDIGEISGRPSTLVDLAGTDLKLTKR